MLVREKRIEIFNKCLAFLDTRVELDQKGFKEDILNINLMNKKQYINIAKNSAKIQISELKKINKIFNKSFIKAVDLILNCKGKVILAGIGKSGLIAKKISATFSSIGIPSFFCDPAQALHGDMGQIEKKDILIIFSYSGNTSELSNMLKYANRYRIKVIGVASKPDSILLKASDVKLALPKVKGRYNWFGSIQYFNYFITW